MNNYSHIAARLFATPLLLDAAYAAVFVGAIGDKLGVSKIELNGANIDVQSMSRTAKEKLYYVDSGVAVIPVNGTLVHKSGYLGTQSGMTGYDGVSALIEDANQDPQVKAILLDVDSPGGEVSGVEALASKIKNSAKPVYSHANEMAASAAYWIASQAKKTYLSNTATVGSIGVITAHTDYSKQLESDGLKVTIIQSGANKSDGNPYEPLPQDVKERIKGRVDALRMVFAAAVAKARKISVEDVLNTEAKTYMGQDAVASGLADEVLSFDAALEKVKSFVKSDVLKVIPQGQRTYVQTSPQGQKGKAMTDSEAHADGQTLNIEAQLKEARITAAAQERARISAILSANNSDTAKHLAFNTDMTPDAAAAILATLPQSSVKASAANALADMAAVPVVEASANPIAADSRKAKVAALIQKL